MDNQAVFQLINDSPLSEEDKVHWQQLVPVLTDEQRKQLQHILTTKIEVSKAIDLIQKSLDIIADAEAEVEAEEQQEATPPQETNPLDDPLAKFPESDPQEELAKQTNKPAPFTEEQLVQMHTDTTQKLDELRNELTNLSHQAHGAPPPSQV